MGLKQQLRDLESITDRVLAKTKNINTELENAMAAAKNYDELVTKLDAATTALGEKIKKITDELEAGGMSAEQEAAKLAQLDAIGDRLIEMGTDPAEPVPPVTP